MNKETPKPGQKSGFAVLVGRSNVGKSTLLNALIGTKVAITTPKPQTTRHAIQGILNDPRGQAVIVDTPGIFTHVPDNLTARLNEKVRQSLRGIDVVIYVVDPTRHIGDEEKIVHGLVTAADCPKIMVINKSDLRGPYADEYRIWSNEFDSVIELSATKGHNLKALTDRLLDLLPEGEPSYPTDILTNLDRNFRIAELIREKVFMRMHEEVPYSTTAEVDEVSERENGILYVRARILTNADRYRGMLIGQGGRTIKAIGQSVRHEMETITGRQVFIDLDVDVEERWQERFE
ncbi:GTPase Era [Candidatus Uhrbacteria bacterium RIFOXYC2_FULL_47_19]|uniref:GTPase Era n=1 Tax=Candidatus Uhrbacteria bacterium RIFOXYC2_FULL_47_19 TaxID=1802424 RepID=A0A1F7WDW7_9BACT|nr:MAG: GTPase Era [Candidatus Uhrbacteria bacterium RIFOXYC2_FULL_47_19]HCC21822.1 GTPase Era [Candidatus Uhrbacteria bacterium]